MIVFNTNICQNDKFLFGIANRWLCAWKFIMNLRILSRLQEYKMFSLSLQIYNNNINNIIIVSCIILFK